MDKDSLPPSDRSYCQAHSFHCLLQQTLRIIKFWTTSRQNMAAANCLRMGRSNMHAKQDRARRPFARHWPRTSSFPCQFDNDRVIERRLAVACLKTLWLPPVSPIPASCSTVWSAAVTSAIIWLQTSAVVLLDEWRETVVQTPIMSSRAASAFASCYSSAEWQSEEPISGNKAF
jgi:hypothetical protein